MTQNEWINFYTKRLKNVETQIVHNSIIVTGTGVSNNKPAALLWIGKQAKPTYYYTFPDSTFMGLGITRLHTLVAKWKTQAEERWIRETELKVKTQAAKDAPLPFSVGEIFMSTWGYEQTNRDFYEITRVGEKAVWLRELRQERDGGWEGGNTKPVPGSYCSEEFMKVPQFKEWCKDNNGFILSFPHGGTSKWNGQAVYYTSYH